MPHSLIDAAPTLASQTMPAVSQATVYTVFAVTLAIGILLRARASRAVGSIKRRSLVQRSEVAGATLTHTHTFLGWFSLLCFAVAGIASTGTIVGTWVLWGAKAITDATHHVPLPALVLINVVGIYVLWKAGHLFFDLVEGKAHHGGSDWLVFLGPTIFPLVPGLFGRFWTWVYTLIAHLVMHFAIELATRK